MSLPGWHEEPINRDHDRDSFDSGHADLDTYLKRHARRNHERGVAKTILAIADETRQVLGYYSLSPASIDHARTPEIVRKAQGRYEVAGFRLGRLAVSRACQGLGLGGQLLLSAAARCVLASAEVGGTVLVIDAASERAARWYETFGAMPLLDTPLTLVIPLAMLGDLLREEGKL